MIYITDLQKRCESFIKETHITITQFCILIELSREALYSWVKGELTLSEETLARIERYLDSQDAKSLLEKSQKYLPVNECTKRVGLSAYKINSLVKKGYLRRVQSEVDRREYHLEVTQKYLDYYNISSAYMMRVMERIQERFTPQECEKLTEMLQIISRDLMLEIDIPEVKL